MLSIVLQHLEAAFCGVLFAAKMLTVYDNQTPALQKGHMRKAGSSGFGNCCFTVSAFYLCRFAVYIFTLCLLSPNFHSNLSVAVLHQEPDALGCLWKQASVTFQNHFLNRIHPPTHGPYGQPPGKSGPVTGSLCRNLKMQTAHASIGNLQDHPCASGILEIRHLYHRRRSEALCHRPFLILAGHTHSGPVSRLYLHHQRIAIIILIPSGKTNVLGQLHSVPLSLPESRPFRGIFPVLFYAFPYQLSVMIGQGSALGGIMMILSCI